MAAPIVEEKRMTEEDEPPIETRSFDALAPTCQAHPVSLRHTMPQYSHHEISLRGSDLASYGRLGAVSPARDKLRKKWKILYRGVMGILLSYTN